MLYYYIRHTMSAEIDTVISYTVISYTIKVRNTNLAQLEYTQPNEDGLVQHHDRLVAFQRHQVRMECAGRLERRLRCKLSYLLPSTQEVDPSAMADILHELAEYLMIIELMLYNNYISLITITCNIMYHMKYKAYRVIHEFEEILFKLARGLGTLRGIKVDVRL